MGVIVKGMKKPLICEQWDEEHEMHRCPFLDELDDCKLQNCEDQWTWEEQIKGCPLIEIPEGARLIDVNRLKAVFDKNVTSAHAFDVIFDDAPTVFEED